MTKTNGGTQSFSHSFSMGPSRNLRALLNDGVTHHQNGRLKEAAEAYQRVLDLNAQQPDALHLMGVIAYQGDDQARAEQLIRQAIGIRPNDASYYSNLGLVLMELGQLDDAAAQYEKVKQLNPGHADGHFNLGLVQQAQRKFRDAVASYQKALDLQPGHLQALQNLGGLLQILGDLPRAIEIYKRTLQLQPDHIEVLINLASAYEGENRLAEARECYERVLGQQPDNTMAIVGMGSVCRREHDLDRAFEYCSRAAALDPNNPDICKNYGLVLKELGRIEEACEQFEVGVQLQRLPGSGHHEERHTFCHTHRAKLKHDIEQFAHLAEEGLLPDEYRDLSETYQSVLGRLPADIGEGRIINLPRWALDELGPTYNKLVYRETADELDVALNPALDQETIQRDYFSRDPGITYLDDLLTPEAMQRLREFCMRTTFWYDFAHQGGYLGAYLEDGFYCPLLLQIADELCETLPEIFGDHHLMQMWAYKYDSRLTGIDMHADFAAINVNFWITPDDANQDPESGGLIVWNKEAPKDWDFQEYNTSEDAGQARITEFLANAGAQPFVVPHRQNRVVIFNSDLFHKTAEIRFKEGYENRRINITMLFGRRDQDQA